MHEGKNVTFSSVILFLPSHNSSRPANVSKFSMSYTIINIVNPIDQVLSPYSYSVGSQLQIPELVQSI